MARRLFSLAFFALYFPKMLFHRILDPTLRPYVIERCVLKYVLLVEHDALGACANEVLVITVLPTLVALVVASIELQGHYLLLLTALFRIATATAVTVFPTLLTITHFFDQFNILF